ncbi:HPr-rel-A system PqqD family peptide chaperone [Methylomonas sp. MgM2]
MKWSVCRSFEIGIRAFDQESVLFHFGSGATHLLSSVACQVIQILIEQKKPMSEKQLILGMSQRSGRDFDLKDLDSVLRQLQELQLVETV